MMKTVKLSDILKARVTEKEVTLLDKRIHELSLGLDKKVERAEVSHSLTSEDSEEAPVSQRTVKEAVDLVIAKTNELAIAQGKITGLENRLKMLELEMAEMRKLLYRRA